MAELHVVEPSGTSTIEHPEHREVVRGSVRLASPTLLVPPPRNNLPSPGMSSNTTHHQPIGVWVSSQEQPVVPIGTRGKAGIPLGSP
ncbi:hypothetical protein NHX12_024997 [Muraenolepis orangiensis]|uniref:Uncharacterized protein n=1 Tax=Muraenolepis orangiensis TaxID=630683 RepID=A0A9Q0ISY1_9TELE|nr:hypothetical protein NHX12_024997 [Muraenolepis orangiensis]